jgi:hypothetical protein
MARCIGRLLEMLGQPPSRQAAEALGFWPFSSPYCLHQIGNLSRTAGQDTQGPRGHTGLCASGKGPLAQDTESPV